MAVLNGEVPDCVPVIPQTFMFAIENAGMKMADVVRNPARMADALIHSMDQFGYDACVIDFDVVTLAEACGAKVVFRENDPAVLDESDLLVKDWGTVASLRVPDPWNDGGCPYGWRPPASSPSAWVTALSSWAGLTRDPSH